MSKIKKGLVFALSMALGATMAACTIVPDYTPWSSSRESWTWGSSRKESSSSASGGSENVSSSEELGDTSSETEPQYSSVLELPPTSSPDSEKELIKTETDSIGHKIAYYSDGSWEDLGRELPIDYTPDAPTTKQGYQALQKEARAAVFTQFYTQAFEQARRFHASSDTVVADKHGYYSLPALDTKAYGLTMDELTSVWGTMKQDYPEFYWMSNQVYAMGVDGRADEFYVCLDEAYSKGQVRKIIQSKIEQSVLECDKYVNGLMSEAERALTVHDYLVADITYAYESDGVTPVDEAWAHNIEGWANRNSGVCETYAETFTFLCGLFDVEAATVVGVAAETGVMGGHAWNMLKLDNEWHAVDVTWDDGLEKSEPDLVSREWFGVPATEFGYTHVADTPENGWGVRYQTALPKLSEKGLSPVLWRAEGGTSTWSISIDKAFEKMTDEGGRYEITLYPKSKILSDYRLTLYPDGARFSAAMPKVASLTFKGNFIYIDGNMGYMPKLTCNTAWTLNGDLTLDCVYLSTYGLQENGHRWTTKNNAEVYLLAAV